MPQIREQIAMVHLPPSKTLKYLFHVRKTKTASIKGYLSFFTFLHFTLVSLFFRLPVVRSLHYSLFTFLSSLNLSSLAEEGEPRQGKPEGFCGVIWNLNRLCATF